MHNCPKFRFISITIFEQKFNVKDLRLNEKKFLFSNSSNTQKSEEFTSVLTLCSFIHCGVESTYRTENIQYIALITIFHLLKKQ